MYQEFIVGFDVREMWLDVNSQWNQIRKNQFLIRHNVLKPLSVDHYVWYSVFSRNTLPRLWADVLVRPGYQISNSALNKPEIYSNRGIFLRLDELMKYLKKHWSDQWDPCALIAITEINHLDSDYLDDQSVANPLTVDKNWIFLGYDVADYDLYTGLSDGALAPNEAQTLRLEWEEKLNRHHLFNKMDDALAFIGPAENRIPSHVPFQVYGMYLIHKIDLVTPIT